MTKEATPKIVTVRSTTGANPTLYLTPDPIVFKGGKAELPEHVASILLADKGNIDPETKRPLFEQA